MKDKNIKTKTSNADSVSVPKNNKKPKKNKLFAPISLFPILIVVLLSAIVNNLSENFISKDLRFILIFLTAISSFILLVFSVINIHNLYIGVAFALMWFSMFILFAVLSLGDGEVIETEKLFGLITEDGIILLINVIAYSVPIILALILKQKVTDK